MTGAPASLVMAIVGDVLSASTQLRLRSPPASKSSRSLSQGTDTIRVEILAVEAVRRPATPSGARASGPRTQRPAEPRELADHAVAAAGDACQLVEPPALLGGLASADRVREMAAPRRYLALVCFLPARSGFDPGRCARCLAAILAHGCNLGLYTMTVEAAAAGPAAGVVAEASSRPGTGAAVTGPDVEPDIVPTAGSVVQVLAAADRSRAFTASPSPPAGLVAGA